MRRASTWPLMLVVATFQDARGGGAAVLEPPPVRRRRRRTPPPPLPPDRSGGGSGGGGGRDDDAPEPHGDADEPFDAADAETRAVFALGLVLAGVTTLFCVLLGAWALMRTQSGGWPPPGSPAPPDALWLSSALLLASSLVLLRGQRALRARRAQAFARAAAWSALFGLAFLAAQVLLWRALAGQGLLPSTNGYGTIFYALTAAHALHVVVGVGLLARMAVLARMRAGAHALVVGTRVAATYWHFLGVLWAVLFVLLYFVR